MELQANSYGKSAVRLTKVVRNGARHELFEIDAAVTLEGDFESAYRDGDNRKVIATDSIRNTVYVLAKENSFDSIEQLAVVIARHFVATYLPVRRAEVVLEQASWRRIEVDGKSHDHAFTCDGPQRRFARATFTRGDGETAIWGGVKGLLVLKTTASEWRDFVDDRYRTLKDTRDRIVATRIDAEWRYGSADANFGEASGSIDAAILSTFAMQHSLGVQQTLLAMGHAALEACGVIESIRLDLPNMHRIPFNLEPFGLKFENDIFVATDEPFGMISGTVSRTKEPRQ